MNWFAGSQHHWPEVAFRLLEGDLLLVCSGTNDFGLMRLERGRLYPGVVLSSAAPVSLKLQAIDASRVELVPDGDPLEGVRWLDEKLSEDLGVPPSESPSVEQLLHKLTEQHQLAEQHHQSLLASHQSLNEASEQQLFWAMEMGHSDWVEPLANPELLSGGGVDDPVLLALRVVCRDQISLLPSPMIQTDLEPRERLQQLLDRTDLMSRDVLIDRSDLQQDCGDLIGFMDQPSGAAPRVVVLQSTAKGYLAWVPECMVEPLPIQQCDRWLNGLSPRMLSISPAFQAKDLSTIGLLRFAYGQPTHFINFVLGGLLIGVSIGFLLAIGRDVGAARWIFGMGATGAIAGTCLGVLSGGFRLGVGVMLLSTLLSLLTPTFNTVITNQALPDRDLGLLLQISVILAAAGITRVCFEWVQSRAGQSAKGSGPFPASRDAPIAAPAH
jgi:ATP-binding cassette subfamily B protein